MQVFQAAAQVDILAAQALLSEHRSDLRGLAGLARGGGADHHVSQARGQRHVGQRFAVPRQIPLPVQGLDAAQQRSRLGEGGCGRRVQERQARRIARAPTGQIQRQARKVCLQDFRPSKGRQRTGLRLVPQTVANARFGPAGAASPLVGGGAADADGIQPRDARGRIIARHAGLAGVDHDSDALDGQAGLGDRGGQHHLAAARRRWGNGAILRGGLQRAVQGSDVDIGPTQTLVQPRLGPANLALARQEDQNAAGFLGQGPLDGAADPLFKSLALIAAQIASIDREHSPLALDDRRIGQQRRDPGAVQGGRHDEQAEVVAQDALDVAREGQAQIGVQAALVKLVEQHRRDPVQAGVVENHARENTLGDDLDPGPGRDLRLQTDSETHRLADGFTQVGRHARRSRAGGQAPGFQDDDLALLDPRLSQERQGNDGRFARAGRRDQHGRLRSKQRRLERGQDILDRQHWVEA